MSTLWEAGGAAGSRCPNYPGSGAPLLPLASWSPIPGRWVWVRGASQGLLVAGCTHLPLHFFFSLPLSLFDRLAPPCTIPPLQTQRASFPLHLSPSRCSPVPTPHRCLWKPFSSLGPLLRHPHLQKACTPKSAKPVRGP